MNFENFTANYKIDPKNAIIMAHIFGVKLAQIQMWVIQLTTKKG